MDARPRRVAGWGLAVLAWAVLLGSLAALTVAVLVPRLAGATPYTVLSGSMRPSLPPGTLVVARPVDPAQIRVGSVVTYQLRSGEPDVVTHRVVGEGFDSRGALLLRTQGDANDVPDAAWVRPVQVKGEVWYAVPHLGRVGALVTADQRRLGVYAVAAVLLAYALRAWSRALRDRIRPATVEETHDVHV